MNPNDNAESGKAVRWSAWFGNTFRRKPKRPKPETPRPKEWWEDDWAKVKELYPVGKSFDYLGRKLVVAQYRGELLGLYGPWRPYMVCEYADDKGKLHEWCFEVEMTPLLLPNNRI